MKPPVFQIQTSFSVVKGRVVSRTKKERKERTYLPRGTYGVLISKVFRGLNSQLNGMARKNGLYVRIRSKEYLFNNTNYLLAGSSDKYGLRLSNCDMKRRWNWLSREEIASVNAGYDCSCLVTRWYEGDNYCKMYGRTRYSYFDIDKKTRSCSCARKNSGVCSWDSAGCGGSPIPPTKTDGSDDSHH